MLARSFYKLSHPKVEEPRGSLRKIIMDIELASSVVEAAFLLWFFYDFVIRGGRIRRFLWKLALWFLLMMPCFAVMNLDFESQVQVDVSMSVLASTFVSSGIWIVIFDPSFSPAFTVLQLATLCISIGLSTLIMLGGRKEGTWEEQKQHLARVPAIIWTFFIRLPWDGPSILVNFCWTIIWYYVSRNYDADDLYPPHKLYGLKRTLQMNGTVYALD